MINQWRIIPSTSIIRVTSFNNYISEHIMIRTHSQSETHHYPPLLERRPTYAEVDLDAFKFNFQAVRKTVPRTKIIAIVKADAYGHGLLPISHYLEKLKADYLGVGFLEEGVTLRDAGIKMPIVVLGGVAGFQIDYFMEYNLELTASSHVILSEIDRRARRMNKKARVHLKIDTGINRIGVNFRRAKEFLLAAAELPAVEVASVYSHLASAESDPAFTTEQGKRLGDLAPLAEKIFGRKVPFHLLNSAGIINDPKDAMDWVRPGLMLYGMTPDISYLSRNLVKPVMSLKSEVVFVKRVPKGEGISYGLTYITHKETNIATIPIGYGDGYPVRLSNKGEVLIGGKRYPVAGKVCMDQIMVDVGDDRIRVGEEVVLIGQQGNDRITVEKICHQTGAVPYEITVGIKSRVPRLYIEPKEKKAAKAEEGK